MSTEQTPALDIWSAGITFLSMFCRKHPLFRPEDDFEALIQLGIVFGTQKFVDFAEEKGISLLFPKNHPGMDLVKFVKAMRGGMSPKNIYLYLLLQINSTTPNLHARNAMIWSQATRKGPVFAPNPKQNHFRNYPMKSKRSSTLWKCAWPSTQNTGHRPRLY